MKFVKYSFSSHAAFQLYDVVTHAEKSNVYAKDRKLVFRVWTNSGRELRKHGYRCVVMMPSYHERERETIPGVVKNAVKDVVEAIKEGTYKSGQVLILMADGTNKQQALESVTGPYFLQTMFDLEIYDAVERYQIDFATIVTEDSTIFNSHPGQTDIRGKGSQFECALNFIYRVCVPEVTSAENIPSRGVHVFCIDSDLGNTEGWIGRLYQVMRSGNADYTTSYFLKYKYDDMITVQFSYPLIGALAGVAVRQCMTGIFAFNVNVLQELVLHSKWNREWRGYGIDVAILLTAIKKRTRMSQVPQETPANGPVHYAQEHKMFQQVCGSLFRQLEPLAIAAKSTSEVLCPQRVSIDPRLWDFSHLDYTYLCPKESRASHYLHFFMSLYAKHDFQTHAEDVLDQELFNKVKSVHSRFKENTLGTVTDYQSPVLIPEHKTYEFSNVLLRLSNENFLNASAWANVVMRSVKYFYLLKRKHCVEVAIERVVKSVLPCVFHLRCLSFIMEAWDLTSYPDTEELTEAQRDEFVRVKNIIIGQTSHS